MFHVSKRNFVELGAEDWDRVGDGERGRLVIVWGEGKTWDRNAKNERACNAK